MPFRMRLLPLSLAMPIALVVGTIYGGEKHDHRHEHRQHGSHVHGIGQLNLALEGREMHLELDSPAANLVGFEHAPSSEADHAALDQALATLKQGDRLFVFNRAAGCRLAEAEIASDLIDQSDHKHKQEGGHEHHGESHADIQAAYRFECANPGKLEQLSVELFEAFAGTERLNVQFVIGDKQGAAELTASDHVVKF